MNYFRAISVLFLAGVFSCASSVTFSQDVRVAEELKSVPSRIAFGSCGHQDKPQPILSKVIQKKPDLFIYLGDNIYGDTTDMKILQAKYDKLGAKPEFQNLRAQIATLSVWDDHDYGWNDAGKEYKFKTESKQIFMDFWKVPQSSPRRKRAGIYGEHRFNSNGRTVQVILLDTRTFRDRLKSNPREIPKGSELKNQYQPDPDPDKTLLGDAQWEWLSAVLKKPADLRVVCSSIQFGHQYNGYESWTNLPAQQTKMIETIRAANASGVVFISGDVHWGEISKRIQDRLYDIYDVTASGITQDWHKTEPNKYRVGPVYPENHFGLIEIDWEQDDPTVTMKIIGLDGKAKVKHSIALSELSPEPTKQDPAASSSAVPTNQQLDQAIINGTKFPKTVDLDDQFYRQVIVDHEKGQYLGHPTTCLLEDGKTILCVYPKGHGAGGVVYKRSLDGGLTWSKRLPTPENWKTSKEVPTLHRVVGADGKKRLIMWSGLYPAKLAVSEDDGENWSQLKPVGDWGGIVVMGFVEQIRNKPGHYLAMFHDDGRYIKGGPNKSRGNVPTGKSSGSITLYKTFSSDGGLTWSAPEAVHKAAKIHLCEPGCIRSPDGKRMAVLLRENQRNRNSYIIFSDDEGQTWSQPRELPLSLTGDRHTGKYAPDGRLFISFRCRSPKRLASKRPFEGDWVGWVGTWDDLVDGTEGQYSVRLKDNKKSYDTTYPGVETLPDGTFVVTTYGHWTKGEPPYIMSVRFKLSELDQIAKKSK